MKIGYSKKARKVLEAMNSKAQERFRTAIKKIPEGDIKLLQGTQDTYRLRVGSWRILFSYQEENRIFIEKISPRGDAYKGV